MYRINFAKQCKSESLATASCCVRVAVDSIGELQSNWQWKLIRLQVKILCAPRLDPNQLWIQKKKIEKNNFG